MKAGARLFLGLAAVLLFSGGCARGPGSSQAESPASKVEVAGCETWIENGTCAVAGQSLRLWVAGSAPLAVYLGDRRIELPLKSAGDGQSFEIEVPAGESELRIERAKGEVFRLPLAPSQHPSWYGPLRKAFREGHFEEGSRLLAQQSEAEALDRAWKRYLEARYANQRDERLEAARLANEAAKIWRQSGLAANEVRDLAFASKMQADEARYDASRQALEAAAQSLDSTAAWPVVPVRLHFLVASQRAHLAYLTGDVRNALAGLDQIGLLRERHLLGGDEISDLVQLQAAVLAELGRYGDAAGLLDGLKALPISEDRLAALHLNRGWIALLALQAGQKGEDPRGNLESAWSYYAQHGSDRQKLNTQVNLALAALQDKRTDDARRHLELARSFRAKASARDKFDLEELEGRMLLLDGKPQAALEIFEKLDVEANRRHLPAASWKALVGKAEAMAAQGRKEAAVDAYERAEKLEGHELIFIPLDKGRETFLASRERITRHHLELLRELGEDGAVYELVRRRRAQALALLDRDERLSSLDPVRRRKWDEAAAEYRRRQRELERDAEDFVDLAPRQSRRGDSLASRSAELSKMLDEALADLGLTDTSLQPRPSPPGELTLAFFPREGSWLIFARDDQERVHVAELPVAGGAGLETAAAELLELVAPQIRASRKLRILPWGELDFHAVTFEGKPLLAARPVVYGVDAGPALAGSKSSSGGRVLLVGDPTGNLRWAVEEVELAQRVLGGLRGGMRALIGPTMADAEVVRSELERTDFFHFAGHGEFGPSGSQSRLRLVGGELNAADIFTLESVPAQVLLSSCSVGRAARASGVEGLGLANAFILAGSRQVVAATREVNDGETAELIRALYGYLARSPAGEIDLAEALRQAQLESVEKNRGDAWKAFRVFEP